MSKFGVYGIPVAGKVAIVAVSSLSLMGGVALVQNIGDNNSKDVAKPLTYDTVVPYVEEYLRNDGALSDDNTLNVPDTSGQGAIEIAVSDAIQQLIDSGQLDYLKGQNGKDGAPGKDGADGENGVGIPGVQGVPGASGTNGKDGAITAVNSAFTVSGGTLSLKPCAVDQVLSVSGSLEWDCATVSASGVDDNTSNVSAALTLSGTSLGASITDSDNNTVNTPLLDLGLTFATDLELSNAITTAVTGLNLTQYAKQSDLTDSINALNISQYVKTTEMADAISAATSNFVSQTDMTNAISALNLSQYATTGNLAALATRVSALETASADHEGRISALETSAASGYVTGTDLSTALNGYYAKSQTYSQSETDNLLTEKQDTLPACADGQVIKYNTVTSAWECAGDLNTVSPDLSSYATESWVQSQGYAATTALNELLPNNLLAGVGISLANNNGVITINSTAQTDVFEVVSDHTAVAAPNPNKIYIDTGTNPASQWVYENSAWVHIGEVNAELTDYFTKTQTESTISSAIAANNGNYTTTSALTPLLAAKQDKLPACADGQVAKYVLASDSWVCGDDNNTVADLSEYAKEAWVSGQIATNNNSYTTTTDLTALLGNKADKSALAATDDALADETTDRTEADTALADRLDTIESDYLKSSSLGGYVTTGQISDMATKTWVNGEGFLKSGDLSGYATESFVTGKGYITSSALSGYATTTALTTATTDMATNAGVSSGYVAKSALNCSSTQALVGTGTNGTISCRAITNITSGSLTSNTNLITASTLNTVLGNYYTKTELDTKLQKMATGADGPIIFKVVTSMPAPSDQDPNTVYLLKGQ